MSGTDRKLVEMAGLVTNANGCGFVVDSDLVAVAEIRQVRISEMSEGDKIIVDG